MQINFLVAVIGSPSPTLLAHSNSCSATNISGERAFGRVDAALNRAPSATVDKVEAKTMYSANKTSSWLSGKSPEETVSLIETAHKQAGTVRQQEKERCKAYEQGVQEKLHFKRVQLGEKEERRREVTEKLIENFLKFGLWTRETLDTEMAALASITKKKEALKTQISVYRKVIGVMAKDKIMISSPSVPELKRCHTALVTQPLTNSQKNLARILSDPDTLVAKDVHHTRTVHGQPSVYTAKVLQYVHRSDEFKFKCEMEDDPYYMTRAETLTDNDIVRGDMVMLP